MRNSNNQVRLIGHAGGNPEIIELESGKKLAKFSMATNDLFRNSKGEWIEDTQWHRVAAWGKKAEIVEAQIRKGVKVEVNGRISIYSYDALDGSKRFFTEIVCEEIKIPSEVPTKTNQEEHV